MDVEKVFENVTGRKMSPDEVTRYLKFQKEFEVPDTDPTWMIFVWFEFYQRIFEQLPEKARKEAEEVVRFLREASVEVTKATREEVKASREKAGLEITIMQEEAKIRIAAALGPTLETEIRNAVGRLQSQSNRPLHKKWVIVLGVGLAIAFLGGSWGTWSFYKYGQNVGAAKMAAFMRSPDLSILMNCEGAGWVPEWVGVGKEKKHACYPYPDKSGRTTGWQIP